MSFWGSVGRITFFMDFVSIKAGEVEDYDEVRRVLALYGPD